ncbi:MAG TPA: efflux RND transporter periplasmic adaptor subunit [Nitrospirae bacterium]|nr:efflux RND transporter periplasmic adaptor subunit [Nitrospirota bacterium]HEW81669.1 efflux RND transporter periplasmic adaptor subunit [Nitrospirota bacterium]
MKALTSLHPVAVKEAKEDPGILVEFMKAEKEIAAMTVKGTGTVRSTQEISVIPQVSGEVIYTAPGLDAGGFFEKGTVLFRIEDTDYKLALEQVGSSKANAEYELAKIESQAEIARNEWNVINKENETPPNPLVLYGPQLKNAKAALASASAKVDQAKLNLARTEIKAPFSVRIRSENVEVGQYVRSGNSVAVLAGTDTAEVAVSLTAEQLRWLNMESHNNDAVVRLNISGTVYEWAGHVVRSTGEIDEKSRMMQVIVEINDPYGLKKKRKNGPSLAAGSFVEVLIKGRNLKNVFVIPRTALRDNSTVWIMDKKNKLKIADVVPLRFERERVIINKGIVNGDIIVLTNLSGAANGMKLRTIK